MEKAKTAEDVLFNHDPRKHKYGAYYHKWQIDAMQEYGQLCAEQARREEREGHEDAILLLKTARVALIIKGEFGAANNINKALAAAGYGKEEHK